jgi:antitoxin component of MazEF toxin-antitoxin module
MLISKCRKFGSSLGFVIPSKALYAANIIENESVEVEASPGSILIKKINTIRNGWAEQFKEMSNNKEDELLLFGNGGVNETV